MQVTRKKGRLSAQLTVFAVTLLLTLSGLARAQKKNEVEEVADHQQAAIQAQQHQDFVTAIREYRILAHMLPQSGEIQSNLGIALYFHGEYEKATETFRRSLALNPRLHAPQLFLGLALVRQGNATEAAQALEKALEQDEQDEMSRKWLGYTYKSLGRYREAVPLLELASHNEPDDPDLWYALGQTYLAMAKAATVNLLMYFPEGGRAWQLAAEQIEVRGDRVKAAKFYQEALRRRPDITELRDKVAGLDGDIIVSSSGASDAARQHKEEDTLYGEAYGYGQKAREAWATLGRLDADSYRVHQVLGDAAAEASHYDEAIAEYTIVLRKKPNLPGVHGQLCNALLHLARLSDAINECDAEMAVSPHDVDAYVDAAHARLMNGEAARAYALLTEARKMASLPVQAEKLLGRIYLDRKQYADCIEALHRYLATEKGDASAYYLLARAYRGAGDVTHAQEAIATYKKYSEAVKSANEAQKTLIASRKIDDENAKPAGEQERTR